MPCPSLGPKSFGHSKNVWTGPKRFGPDQNFGLIEGQGISKSLYTDVFVHLEVRRKVGPQGREWPSEKGHKI